MNNLQLPFSNIQVELLRLYSRQVNEKDLIQIKQLIGEYFAKKMNTIADEAWDKNGWSNEEMDNILNEPNQ